MERPLVFASICAACFAVFLLSLYPNSVTATALGFINRFRDPYAQQPKLSFHDGNSTTTSAKDSWNIHYHLGGNGPWIPMINGSTDDSIDPPDRCHVDQVHMMSRHAERYPTVSAGIKMLHLYDRITQATTTLNGSLAFSNDWNFFTSEPADALENLVSTGPYAGTLEAFATGVKLRTRYKQLIDDAAERSPTSFWACDSRRVIETARYFAAGFFGIGRDDLADLHVVPEDSDQAADTLTPGRTCRNYRRNADAHGHDYGYRMMDSFRSTYEPAIAKRLAEENPEMPFTESEIFTMQLICGFETLAQGSSPWCDVLTQEEWESFEYARDVIHYYRAGPGNPYSASMGWLWLNATANLLRYGPSAGPLFFSFVHDGDIIPLLHALDLFPQDPDLPTSHILHNRTWRTSEIVPMGGRIIFERLSCAKKQVCWSNEPFYPNHIYCEPEAYETFVRINVNDGIVAFPECSSGPGSSCPLEDFLKRVRKRGEETEEFGKLCGLAEDAAKSITFLHQ